MDFYVDKDFFLDSSPLIGKTPKMHKVLRDMKKVFTKEQPVFISGERGTYKEFIAKAIHYTSPRLDGPFITLRATSLPKEILEAEFFGSEKGAVKGASKKKTGKIENADGGTLYIDEITVLDSNVQKKLFRFIEDKKYVPVGGSNTLSADVSIIAATNKNIKEVTGKGQIREDLYNSFSNRHIKISPLRERKEDVLPIAKYLLKEISKRFATGKKELLKDARTFLMEQDWPGNIRELEHTLMKAVLFSSDTYISKKDILKCDIGAYSIEEFLEEKLKRYLKEMTKLGNCHLHNTVLSEVEKSLITIVLKETKSNQLKAAKTLGINRNTLRAKIREYKIHI